MNTTRSGEKLREKEAEGRCRYGQHIVGLLLLLILLFFFL